MKLWWLAVGLAGLVALRGADAPVSPPHNVVPEELEAWLPQPGDEAGFRPLFGRTATDGWQQCGPGGFTVTNGVATSHGGMGLWWHTNRMFTNFVVRGEWRFDNHESDTGVFVRFADPGQDPWNAIRTGHELELGDDPEGKDPTWKTGTLYPFQPPTHAPTKPVGEWNSYEFIALGHTYIIRLNGETVTVWTDPEQRSAAGYIGLQNYQDGKGTQHRRFRIQELPAVAGRGTASATVLGTTSGPAIVRPPFFAFQNGFRTSPAELAATLKELGYDGVSAEGFALRPLIEELKARELRLFNTYVTLEFDAATNGLTAPLRTLMDDLEGTGAALWIAITKVTRDGNAFPNSSPEGDAIAAARLAEIADYAEPRGVKMALYPHTWFWLERVADAVRLADTLNRPGVGATFNLCHWLKVEGDTDPVPVLKAALPRLFFVSINGADAGDTRQMDWDRLIQPLDQGSYAVGGLMRQLRALGYSGPVGLQCYNVKGDPKDNLARSMQAWRRAIDLSIPPAGDEQVGNWVSVAAEIGASDFAVEQRADLLVLTRTGQRVGEYVFRDAEIPRPYFAHLHAPDGTRLTRAHPPVKGVDATDHDKLHPGLWLAFGDLNGVDFWRNQGRIEHVRFVTPPTLKDGRLAFAVEEKYLAPGGSDICRGVNAFAFIAGDSLKPPLPGTLLLWSTVLHRADGPLIFGPQHEMGLGFRMATPLVVKGGTGRILGSHGGQNESGNWGHVGSWWNYAGTVSGQQAGILAVAASDNPRPVWAHARDYGFLALNPTGPPPGAKDVPSVPFTVSAGESLHLKFGLLLHASPTNQPMNAARAADAIAAELKVWNPEASLFQPLPRTP